MQLALDCKNLGEAVFLRENVAVATEYGYYRNKENEFTTPRVVVFADMGCEAATLTAVEYSQVVLRQDDDA